MKPRPDWSPLGIKFKISDEHPRLFHKVPRGVIFLQFDLLFRYIFPKVTNGLKFVGCGHIRWLKKLSH